jgi:pimeloyl-ACP methyl ester carboxylesterase
VTAGARCFLLLHGLGATGAVWDPVAALLATRGAGRSVAPDLSGHGGASWAPRYSVGATAADLAPTVAGESELYVVGHSFGGYVALALASGGFAARVQGVLTVGTKLSFSDEDRRRAADLARRPTRIFATEAEALERYRMVAGLDAKIAPDDALLARGTVRGTTGFRLAADPATLGVEVPPFTALLAAARCPVIVARGEHDPLVSSSELRAAAPGAIDLPGRGHNLHVEDPAALVALVERLLAASPCPAKAPP